MRVAPHFEELRKRIIITLVVFLLSLMPSIYIIIASQRFMI
ncbi:hypothetical protein [Peribacillus asahii]|uniref:Uncharacterized protein n=1 Tax=Peribacillus asahii TaxID=228899 RepID=A0A3T0KS29_9BACI|nr:hypothetical protein [Peribacillus asahii]AZV43065.1 hypothetical protein BAOM_2456 [Peribacillus asahii]